KPSSTIQLLLTPSARHRGPERSSVVHFRVETVFLKDLFCKMLKMGFGKCAEKGVEKTTVQPFVRGTDSLCFLS
ncbi:MAG: hypothetical protein OXC68_13860, partial [Aestuariivita sp.]|nr:hypothetical protein [Aestuariivita sp.]